MAILTGVVLRDILKYDTSVAVYEIGKSDNRFINPLIEHVNEARASQKIRVAPLKAGVKNKIDSLIKAKKADNISVYFMSLNSDKSFILGANNLYAPGSLLKVPLMIALLKQAESYPQMLQQTLKYTSKIDNTAGQGVKPKDSLVSGKEYAIEELIYRMVAYSDNNAYFMLESVVDIGILKETYSRLDFRVNPYRINQSEFMSVDAYASFFRLLYDASYLSPDMSQKALEFLANADFENGLRAVLPNNIELANKFGEQVVSLDPPRKELHDCGIVYYPKNPYLICVMTNGRSFDDLAHSIRTVAKAAFDNIDAAAGINRQP